ncbi:MAG: hypothetical protein GYB20_11415 [Oceanospirillales bacterium]|nr:hypothetical protein [Oceanospirillales bacterium]MBR9888287.1 hypothetical protein [Oceanospirillales bacterium]
MVFILNTRLSYLNFADQLKLQTMIRVLLLPIELNYIVETALIANMSAFGTKRTSHNCFFVSEDVLI